MKAIAKFLLWTSLSQLLGILGALGFMGFLYMKFSSSWVVWIGVAVIFFALFYNFLWVGIDLGRRSAALERFEKLSYLFERDFRTLHVFASAPVLACILIITAVTIPFVAVFTMFWSMDIWHLSLWLSILLASLSGTLVYVVGFLIIAELYQRLILSRYHQSILRDLLSDFIYALPLVLLIAIMWWILLLARVRRRNSRPKLSLIFLLEGLSIFTALNLATIALHERRWKSYSDVLSLLKNEYGSIAQLSVFSGALFAPVILWCIVVGFWQPVLELPDGVLMAVAGWPLAGTVILFSCLRQMNFLMFAAEHQANSIAPPLSL